MGLPAQYALTQTVNPATSTGAITATVANTRVGSLILVFVGMSALIENVSTITDNAGNTYLQAYASAGGTGGDTELWYSLNSKPTTSIIVNFSSNVLTKSVFIREYSGISQTTSALDRTITSNGSGTAVTTGASSTTQDTNELVVCNSVCKGTTPTLSVGGGFGNFVSQDVIVGVSLHAIEDLTASGLAPQTGIMTAGGTLPVWDIGLATFIIAGGKFYKASNPLRPAIFKPGQSAYGR